MLESNLEMVRKTPKRRRPHAPQSHPSGHLLTVDEAWKDLVRAHMKREGWNQQDLAGKIPASTGAISNMFKPGERQIRFKRRIEELCGIVNNAKREAALEIIESNLPFVELGDIDAVVSLVKSLAKKRHSGG